jgi:hypothetical protein
MNTDQIMLANLYIALKAKPLAILAGPEGSGKEALVENLASALSGRSKKNLQFQMLTGHPWWAKGDNLTGLVEIQTRFTSAKIMSIFEEVQRPQNCDKAFLICFARISPAELQNFFIDLAFQIQNNRIMRLGDNHFDEPVAFPNNLFITGTIDTGEYRWYEPDLLSKASVIQTGKYNPSKSIILGKAASISVREWMSPIRDPNMAYRKLKSLLTGEKQPFERFLQIQEILHNHNVSTPDKLMDDVVIYLANAWSSSGEGFFAANLRANFEIATDILISQSLLPCIQDALQKSSEFRHALMNVLRLYYPCSFSYLSQLPKVE